MQVRVGLSGPALCASRAAFQHLSNLSPLPAPEERSDLPAGLPGPATGYFSELVDVLMFRNRTSENEDSVRVDLPDGRLIGWITKADSETACQLIEHIAQARDRRERRLPIRLMVSLACEAFWPNYEDGDDPTDPDVRGVDFDLFEVQIQDPIQAEMI